MPLPSLPHVFAWILKALVLVVFVQSAVPVQGQCFRKRRVPTLDFPTDIPMWEIYGINPFTPIKVQPIPFTPLQVMNYAALRGSPSLGISENHNLATEGTILKQTIGDSGLENFEAQNEMKSLRRALEKSQAGADENLRRAKKAESKIVELEEDSKGRALIKQKSELAKGDSKGVSKGVSKGRGAAKRVTAALKQELARLEKSTKLKVKKASQKISREFQVKIESQLKTGKSKTDAAVKSLLKERDEAVARAVQLIREKSETRILEIQKELSARARS
tara:strand:+ start:254 stop:1084 length:831 start_codon:yes stop_codon:yes gene_type:complete